MAMPAPWDQLARCVFLVLVLLQGTAAQPQNSTPRSENSTEALVDFLELIFQEEGLSDQEVLEGFDQLQLQVTAPTYENAYHVNSFLPQMLQSKRLADSSGRPRSANTSDLPPSTNSQCGRLKREALIGIEGALQSSGNFRVKRGIQDWGFLRDEQESQDCADQNCALSNPSSPYGLAVLPSPDVRSADQDVMFQGPDSQGREPSASSQFPILSQVFSSLIGRFGDPGVGIPTSENAEDASAAYQLRAGEVVVLAGCLPSIDISRYFGYTGYIHSIWTRTGWSNVFGSLGDTTGIYTANDKGGTPISVRNRLNSSSPGDDADRPHGQFSVIVMTASRGAARNVLSAIAPPLEALGLQASTNLLPIPFPFTEGMPSGMYVPSTAPYYMLLARNIVPTGKLSAFKEYADGQPFAVWRLTPKEFPASWDPQGPDAFPTPEVIPRTTGAPYSISGIEGSEDLLDMDEKGENKLRPAWEWLLDRVDAELGGSRSHAAGAAGRWPVGDRGPAAAAWNLGSEAGLSVAGVDWGIDCYRREADFCSGDNRDASYILSLPLVNLDTTEKVLYIVGVNHEQAGMAAFMNIAPTDVVLRLGLGAWATPELTGSAGSLMADGPYSEISKLFFVVAFARDCTGIPYCKVIPTDGPRSLPLNRGVLLMLRAYVNPVTGVGPPADYLVKFRAVVATPRSLAGIRDSRGRLDFEVVEDSVCRRTLINTATQCASTLRFWSSSSSGSSSGLFGGGFWGGSSESGLLGGGLLDSGFFEGATGFLDSERPIQDSECCQASKTWVESRCHCSDEGQRLLEGLDAEQLMRGLARICRTGSLLLSCF